MIDSACILAAGLGTRLGERGRERPKAFLEIGGAPIIERSIASLRQVGIENIVVVTGHLAHWFDPLPVARIHNAAYADSGSLRSLACARDALAGDFLLLESDLMYEPRALDVVLTDPHPDVVLASGPTNAGDEVWVEAPNGRLRAMSKDRAALGPHVVGELVGISKISAALYAALLDLDACGPRLAYETDGLVGCADRFDIVCPVIPDLRWGEIDDASHLARVTRLFHGAG